MTQAYRARGKRDRRDSSGATVSKFPALCSLPTRARRFGGNRKINSSQPVLPRRARSINFTVITPPAETSMNAKQTIRRTHAARIRDFLSFLSRRSGTPGRGGTDANLKFEGNRRPEAGDEGFIALVRRQRSPSSRKFRDSTAND